MICVFCLFEEIYNLVYQFFINRQEYTGYRTYQGYTHDGSDTNCSSENKSVTSIKTLPNM